MGIRDRGKTEAATGQAAAEAEAGEAEETFTFDDAAARALGALAAAPGVGMGPLAAPRHSAAYTAEFGPFQCPAASPRITP